MKNLMFIAAVMIAVSCSAKDPVSAPAERAIGFATVLPDNQWHIGTEAAIKIVKDLDVVWAKKDYKAVATFFADTAKFFFEDGRTADSPAGFVQQLKEGDLESDDSWTFDYAFSVDLDPSRGGEHVQAGFTGTSVKDGLTSKKAYHESYYIIDGKIVSWNQYSMDIKE